LLCITFHSVFDFPDALEALRMVVLSENASTKIKGMDQPHFIAMWRSLYDVFIHHEREQDMYHSIVGVGTLLTKLGDLQKTKDDGSKGKETGKTPSKCDSGSLKGKSGSSPEHRKTTKEGVSIQQRKKEMSLNVAQKSCDLVSDVKNEAKLLLVLCMFAVNR